MNEVCGDIGNSGPSMDRFRRLNTFRDTTSLFPSHISITSVLIVLDLIPKIQTRRIPTYIHAYTRPKESIEARSISHFLCCLLLLSAYFDIEYSPQQIAATNNK